MTIAWLEPSVQKRIEQLNSECEFNFQKDYYTFLELLNNIKRNPDEADKFICTLEDMYIDTVKYVEFGYRQAVNDMITLKNNLR